MPEECHYAWIGVVLTSLALFISMCLNVIFCFLRRRDAICRDTDEDLLPQTYHREGFSQSNDEGHHFHDHNHCEHQENPIYGNISTDREDLVEGCYEKMTKQRWKDVKKPRETDLNYASLDLNVATKRKKKHRHQGQTQDLSKLQDPLSHSLVTASVFLDMETEVMASLPSRNSSAMVSHNSIYLNSQQIAQETEERERDRDINMEREHMDWEGIRQRERGGSREWDIEREGEGGMEQEDSGNMNVGTEIVEVKAIHDVTDHFISSFNHDNGQQD